MNQELFGKIGEWFDRHREELLEDLMRLVRIPSISNPKEEPGPFGGACRDAMDEMLAIGREHGFFTVNREYYVGTIGREKQNWANTIGFWNHLDVVPTGAGWSQDPFEPVIRDGFLIGRGAQDNKGPAVGILYLMQCIRELGIPMKHELCLFVGCDEERGMADLEYYTKHYPTPALSMIADSGFPVCYGEKGIVEGQFISCAEFSKAVRRIAGGSASNMIPDRASVCFAPDEELARLLQERQKETGAGDITIRQEADGICVTAKGTSRHSAFPEGSINAIYRLAVFLKELPCLDETDRTLFRFLAETTKEYYGETEGIAYEDEVSGKTTCAGTVLGMEGRRLSLTMNIRYAITADAGILQQRMNAYAEASGMEWRTERDSAPNYFPREHPAVDFLTDLYNEWMGLSAKAFVMGGGTYARKLPNAFAYGIGGMPKTKEDLEAEGRLFQPGTGGAHEPDEGLNLRMFFEAMKFYTLAVAELDRLEF